MRYWGTEQEIIVYQDKDFVIVRHPAIKPNSFVFEVIPITKRCSRLNDIEICPEPDNLEEAKRLMEKNRKWIREYKRNMNHETVKNKW